MSSSGNNFGWGPPPGSSEPEASEPSSPVHPQPAFSPPQPMGSPGMAVPTPGGPQPPTYGAPQAAYARPQAAKPGIVPLRPLSMGEVLDGAFSAIRHNPRVMFGLSFVVAAVTALISLPLLYYVAGDMLEWLEVFATYEDTTVEIFSGGQIAALIATGVLQFVSTLVLTGMLIGSVSRSVIGQKISVNQAWNMAKPRILSLIALSLTVAILVPLASILAFMPFAAIAGFGGSGEGLVALGSMAFLTTFILLLVRTSLSTPTLILEERRPFAAVRRSISLTKGSFWRLVGTGIVALIIAAIVSGIITQPITLLASALVGDPDNMLVPAIVASIAQILSSAVVTPFLAAVICLVYINLRIRREGLSVQLQQAAAEAQAAAGGADGRIVGYHQG